MGQIKNIKLHIVTDIKLENFLATKLVVVSCQSCCYCTKCQLQYYVDLLIVRFDNGCGNPLHVESYVVVSISFMDHILWRRRMRISAKPMNHLKVLCMIGLRRNLSYLRDMFCLTHSRRSMENMLKNKWILIIVMCNICCS